MRPVTVTGPLLLDRDGRLLAACETEAIADELARFINRAGVERVLQHDLGPQCDQPWPPVRHPSTV
jgi:hypothetical protein